MIARKSNQTAVYWGDPVVDGYGKATFSGPEEVDVRWEDHTETFTDREGKERISKALIYTVDDPSYGWDDEGYMYLGTIAGLSSTSDPTIIDNAYEIRRIDKLPELDNVNMMYRIWL